MKIVGVREGGLGNRETGELKYILSSMIKSQNLRVFFCSFSLVLQLKNAEQWLRCPKNNLNLCIKTEPLTVGPCETLCYVLFMLTNAPDIQYTVATTTAKTDLVFI